MAKKVTLGRTPRELADEIAAAERQIVQPPEGKAKSERIAPRSITTRPELFQPRVMGTEHDPAQVRKLERTIATKGELEPPLVVKLGRKWVCVDGHHRLEAYRKRDWQTPIECIWFAGTVREAVDEGVRRNTVVKLDMGLASRQEAAWQRVVLGWGSKKQIIETTNVSDGVVAMMRRVEKSHRAQDSVGAEFRKRLPRNIKQVSWSEARIAYLNGTPTEWDHEKAAETLARQLRKRMEGKLSENVVVTALALKKYDEDLPRRLIGALQEALEKEDREENTREPEDPVETPQAQSEEAWLEAALADISAEAD